MPAVTIDWGDRPVTTDEVASAIEAAYAEVPGADHNDPVFLDGDAFLDPVDTFRRAEVSVDDTG
jgi:hypothetical protein